MSMTALTQYPATRKEAKQKNSKWYFTGDPCKFGHIAPRMTANCGCKVCLYKRREEYENSENYTNWKKNNKQKVANRYIKNNLPKILANTRKYQAAKKNRIPSWISKNELEKINQASKRYPRMEPLYSLSNSTIYVRRRSACPKLL